MAGVDKRIQLEMLIVSQTFTHPHTQTSYIFNLCVPPYGSVAETLPLLPLDLS